MNKLLLICSIVALIYGDFAFGMDYNESELYKNPWRDTPSKSQKESRQSNTGNVSKNDFEQNQVESKEKKPSKRAVYQKIDNQQREIKLKLRNEEFKLARLKRESKPDSAKIKEQQKKIEELREEMNRLDNEKEKYK